MSYFEIMIKKGEEKPSHRETAHVTMTVATKGRIFHPHCDGWRIDPVAIIRDQLEEDPREASSSNGRSYNSRQ